MVLWSMTLLQVRVTKIIHRAFSILYWPPTNISRYGVIYRKDTSRKENKINGDIQELKEVKKQGK